MPDTESKLILTATMDGNKSNKNQKLIEAERDLQICRKRKSQKDKHLPMR